MLASEIEILIRPILEESQFELVELKVKGSARYPLFQLFVDHEKGVTVADCSRISKNIGMVLDSECPDLQNYRLEVSSPGLDRPLTTERDFRKNTGRIVRIVYGENEPEEIIGTIESVRDGEIQVKVNLDIQSIPIRLIRSAKIQLKW